MMQVELVPFKSKSWGIIALPGHSDHFHTGYEHEWNLSDRWELNKTVGTPNANMQIGTNAIITGLFRIDNWSRGRSAANFHGHFRSRSGVSYAMSMDGVGLLWELVQNGKFPLKNGYIEGRFTFTKNGQNIFLKPEVC